MDPMKKTREKFAQFSRDLNKRAKAEDPPSEEPTAASEGGATR
ncbi:hypothetical protein ACFL6C_08940 [Myxococcota bacterium]